MCFGFQLASILVYLFYEEVFMNEDMMQFEHAIDMACRSKFIMVDKRVSDILKAIAGCSEVFEAIKKCMIGFDFGRELKIATTIEGHFAQPTDTQRAVALTFCLLSALDDKKIDVNQLLSKSFAGEDPYAKFCDEILVKFKDDVFSMIIVGNEQVEKKKAAPLSSALADRAEYLARGLEEYTTLKGKEYLDCFIKSTKMKDKQFMLVFFDLLSKNVKRKGKKLIAELGTVCEVIKEQ